jgi:YidC/Oxa1 family membrane protein insertase
MRVVTIPYPKNKTIYKMDTQRLLLFVGLSLVLFLLWDAWQREVNPPPVQPAISERATTPSTAADVPVSTEAAPTTSPSQVPAGDEAVQRAESLEIVTDVLRAVIDTHGGDLRQVDLLKYPVKPKEPDVPFRLMNDTLPQLFIAQTGFASKRPQEGVLVDAPNHHTTYKGRVEKDEQGMERVILEWVSPQGVKFSKIYVFQPDSYLIEVQHQVENPTTQPWHGNLYQQLQRSGEEPAGGLGATYTYTGGVIWSTEDKYQKINFDDMQDEDLQRDITGGWAAMIQHYFLGAWVPANDVSYTYYTRALPRDLYVLGMKAAEEMQVAPQSSESIRSRFFVGPKLQHELEKVAPGLELTVDYGVLTIIAKPLFWLLEKIHSWVGNWGWSIVLLTLLIKLVFYKLSETSYKSMAHMRKVQPRLQSIKERYGSDRQKLNQAMMDIYKKEKINPLGGCLPILVQIPVFIALYWMLLESVELRQAPWILWITDLSTKDPYFVLPIVMGITMLVQQKLNPTPLDPIQAKVMMALPFVFTVFFLFFPAGLVLYWVVNNTLSIAQQWYITRIVIKS